MKRYLLGTEITILLFIIGCGIQPNTLHDRNEWTEIGHNSGRTISRIHSDIFEEAATKEWKTPKELSDYLLERSREELPKAYQDMGIALALDLGSDWDEERVQYILKEIAKGYREVR